MPSVLGLAVATHLLRVLEVIMMMLESMKHAKIHLILRSREGRGGCIESGRRHVSGPCRMDKLVGQMRLNGNVKYH